MITKTEDGVNIFVFGSGDIKIGAGLDCKNMEIPMVTFSQGDTSPIGEVDENACTRDENGYLRDTKAHTRFYFEKEESIDLLILMLEKAKEKIGLRAEIKANKVVE